MKRTYLPFLAMGMAAVVMAGCFGGSKEKDITTNVPVENDAVAESLVVELGSSVAVQYIGRMAGSEDASMEDMIADCAAYEVFDTSYEELAQACDVYSPQRVYGNPLTFIAGTKQLIAGFENAVMGRTAGDTMSVTIPSTEAYGEWSEEYIVQIPVAELPPKADGSTGAYVEGDEILTPLGPITITSIEGDTASLDANHPLAGKDLIFDIEIVDVMAPNAESLQQVQQAAAAAVVVQDEEVMVDETVEEEMTDEDA